LVLPQRREGRRDVFSYSLPLILQKYQGAGMITRLKRGNLFMRDCLKLALNTVAQGRVFLTFCPCLHPAAF
jgi:hypothetical protein